MRRRSPWQDRPTRRRSSRRKKRNLLPVRAPRKGTLIIACILYAAGLSGVVGILDIPQTYVIVALAIAGGLLILGALLRDL